MLLGAITVALTTRTPIQEVTLTPIAEGAVKLIGYHQASQVHMTDGTSRASKLPSGLEAPSYGSIRFQNTTFGVIIDHPSSGDYKLYVDSNANGDFTDDPSVDFVKSQVSYGKDAPRANLYTAAPKVDLVIAGKKVSANLGLYLFDQNDSLTAKFRNIFFYYPDFAAEGNVSFRGRSYSFLLSDPAASEDSRGQKGAQILIDRRGTSNYGQPFDLYRLDSPINLNHSTLAVESASFVEGTIRFRASEIPTAEVPLPLTVGRGDPCMTFQARTTTGKSLNFPEAYRGRLVLLDFWATWCIPCMEEMPNIVANYKEFHPSGLDVLGISMDDSTTVGQIPAVTKQHSMTWSQICDRRNGDSALAKEYNVMLLPHLFLVDGSTGTILAEGFDLKGAKLKQEIQKALASTRPNLIKK